MRNTLLSTTSSASVPDSRRVIRVDHTELETMARRRNELILANFRLSFQAYRLFMFVLSLVKEDHTAQTEYEFSVNQLANAIGVDSTHLYKSMVEIVDELADTRVNVPVFDAKGKPIKDTFVRIGLLQNKQKVKVIGNGEQLLAGSISVSIHKELLPYVQHFIDRYTAVELKYVFRLTSSYAQRLYDLLKMRAFMGRPWRVEKDKLRELLVVEKDKFKLWGDFRRYVLERAQTEISTHTDLAFDIEYITVGRAVTELIFHLRKEGGQEVEVLPGTNKHQAFKGMMDLGLSGVEAEKILRDWWDVDPERIRWHVAEARRQKAAGRVQNGVGWFLAGMREDYRPAPSLFQRQADAEVKRAAYEPIGGRDEALKQALSEMDRHMSAE